MSLVNYYSSSDDENSGDEEKTDDYVDAEVVSVDSSNSSRQASESSLFSSLPAPKSSQISSPEETETTQSPTLVAGTSSHCRLGYLNLPLPKKRSTQPIKITAPSLPETNSDDEEDEPTTKRAKPAKTKYNLFNHESLHSRPNNDISSSAIGNHMASEDHMGLSGLFAMLPKPRIASLKEANRILIPHTLTKRPTPSKPVSKPKQASLTKSKPGGTVGGLLATSYGSDDDDDDDDKTGQTSFFSFGDSSKVGSSSEASTSNLASTNITPKPFVVNKITNPSKPQSVLTSHEGEHPGRLPQPACNAPLDFGPSTSSQNTPLAFKPSSNPPVGQDSPLKFSESAVEPQYSNYHASQYADPQTYAAPYGYQYSEYNQPYQEQDLRVYADPQGSGSGEGQGSRTNQPGVSSNLAADKEFQRLMGKHNIGKEAINMIDITADEQIGPNNHLDWTKSLTEEKEYRAKLKKEQLPSGQQKRKHQITFLAHQAKERELELKNQWAANRQTRQQTQMKYGF